MRFSDPSAHQSWRQMREDVDHIEQPRVAQAIANPQRDISDFIALISPAATPLIEQMTRAARDLTVRHFGRTVRVYAPLYLSNLCTNSCRYCHYQTHQTIPRITLTSAQFDQETDLLHSMGIRHLLLVSGEAPSDLGTADLARFVAMAAKKFPSVSLETYPHSVDGYEALVQAGAVGLAVYQETYHLPTYQWAHPAGPKANYAWRLDALDRAAEAGMRKLGVGALLGLHDWRFEAIALVHHAQHLIRRHWRARVSISVPRLRSGPSGFEPPCPVSDDDLRQLIVSLRLLLPHTPILLSTREPASIRDAFIPIGITQMSAGSRTDPGGYGNPHREASQFEVADARSAAQIAEAITHAGYDPVWKDWEGLVREESYHADSGERTPHRSE